MQMSQLTKAQTYPLLNSIKFYNLPELSLASNSRSWMGCCGKRVTNTMDAPIPSARLDTDTTFYQET